ncbi:xanthine dehydrogenase family protein molybdopterin-binding subunit [Streptomyces tubercidicus]|uniref:xanthine dehydrogenase family protein molybdopterin-binding subunit n=1 Tax=Streptomyces tubercidicus TaxID=47759 RepID=UPI003465E3D6
MSTIGSDLPRRDAKDKLRGRTRFTVDRRHYGMLHAAVRRSDCAAARIIRIDATAARRMPGVHAIATAADAPGRYGIGVADHPLFADKVIRYLGEPLVAVAAETKAQAESAAAAVIVEIEPLAPNLTMDQSLAAGAREIHPDWASYEELVGGGTRAGNIAWEATVVRGDTAAAFARDDVVVVESCFRSGRQNQAPLEPRACTAWVEHDRLVMETSTQNPWAVRNGTARLLGLRPSDVRVVVPPVGGGFGMKFEVSIEPIAAVLARATDRPVKLVLSREEEMRLALFRENADVWLRSAVTRDGEIVAREAVVLMDCGAYGGEQPFLTTMTAHTLGGNYRLGAVRMISRAVYTNTAPTGAFRACNGAYNTFALERHTDEICAAIGMNREEFRSRTVLGDGDIGATGQVFEGDVLRPMLDRMRKLRGPEPARTRPGELYGRATVVGTWFIFVGPSAATVNVNPDGTATLVTAGVEIGSGSTMQAIPQLVAESLGIHPQDVVVRAADTDAAGFDLGVGGGRTTVSLGAASRAACDDAKRKIARVAAELLDASPDEILFAPGAISVAGIPSRSVTLAQVAAHAQTTTGPVSGSGSFTARGTPSMPGCAAGHMIDAIDIPVFAVHDCEIAVDPDTGHVRVLAYRVVQDVGKAINPRAIRGQIQGGVVQGLGFALHETVTFDDAGQVAQSGFETYRVPLAGDSIPVEVDLFEGAPSLGPLGVKGAGEVPILNVAGAVACAVADATGRQVDRIPLTPPRVISMLDGTDRVRHPHIPRDWRANVLTPSELLEAAVDGARTDADCPTPTHTGHRRNPTC